MYIFDNPYIELIMDYVSVSNLALVCFPFLNFLITSNIYYGVFCLAIILCHVITVGLKLFTSKTFTNPIFLRPRHARNCDYMCRNGLVGGKPGFPSGHMSSTLVFFTFIILYKLKVEGAQFADMISLTLVSASYILATAFARYYKGCHNITQIVAGSILGSTIGLIMFKVYELTTI